MHSNLLYSSLNLYLSNLDSAILAPVDENGGEMGCDEGVNAARGPGHIRVRICEMLSYSSSFSSKHVVQYFWKQGPNIDNLEE